jgi:hypothetical protein
MDDLGVPLIYETWWFSAVLSVLSSFSALPARVLEHQDAGHDDHQRRDLGCI